MQGVYSVKLCWIKQLHYLEVRVGYTRVRYVIPCIVRSRNYIAIVKCVFVVCFAPFTMFICLHRCCIIMLMCKTSKPGRYWLHCNCCLSQTPHNQHNCAVSFKETLEFQYCHRGFIYITVKTRVSKRIEHCNCDLRVNVTPQSAPPLLYNPTLYYLLNLTWPWTQPCEYGS